MIKKTGTKYSVYTADGSRKLGTHTSKADAVRQLQAIEIAKKARGKR